jgi:Arc/MetJ family transcription regulator
MTEPRPAEHFLDLLLKSEGVGAACKAALGERSADVIARATRGDTTDFLEWFEEWV